ncbi:putative MFS monocarboxylate transporter [Aspergillus steynii IBT 23096]|uniref:Putative MFS monocarboxylate transporter n=1 Tax=Aspergillus steynii IBT 23096 TaxID=1392250 RepID=A0A2I2GMN1_9EURO|nr:putative MFS monocarboxylate transporter [Aspergillus steynii IBT 23096]PLB54133.1 putative MFS monocarboxylate transporter [Aspergillus steynii IBT 23096]
MERKPVTTQQWAQVLSAFVVFLNTWGILLSFGTFQAHWEHIGLSGKSRSEISWVSTICAFILLLGGLITGPLYDHGYLRPLVVLGGLLEVFGLMMISLSTEYYQVFLSQGICIGLGGALLFVPSVSAAAGCLEEFRRAKFMGLIASGAGVGGVIYPIMLRQIQLRIGFPWAIRCVAFVILATYILAGGILRYKPVPSANVRRVIDPSALTDPPFLLSTISFFFAGIAYYLPLIYLPVFAQSGTAGFSNPELAFYLVPILNAASIFGRFAAGFAAMKAGAMETFTFGLASCICMLLCWMAVSSGAGVIVWSAFWGLTTSVIVSLPGAIVPLLCPSLDVLGTRSGMFWGCAAFGILVGPPIGGALVKGARWWPLQVFAAACMFVGVVLLVYPIGPMEREAEARKIPSADPVTRPVDSSP